MRPMEAWRRRTARALAWAGLMIGMAGCIPRHTAVAPAPAGPAAGATASEFTAVAVPVYRLVATRAQLDAPSRLLVVQLRIMSTGAHSYTVGPGDLTVALPDGTHARIFDSARADQLLRRTYLADADLSYLLRPGHVPGGVAAYSSGALAQMVESNLLREGIVTPEQPLQGYIVIDTGEAMSSIEGASFEVIARRVGDYAPARYAYQLATSGSGTAGTQ